MHQKKVMIYLYQQITLTISKTKIIILINQKIKKKRKYINYILIGWLKIQQFKIV